MVVAVGLKTEFEKLALRRAKNEYKKLRKNEGKFNETLNQILTSFSISKLPDWGTMKFNGQTV